MTDQSKWPPISPADVRPARSLPEKYWILSTGELIGPFAEHRDALGLSPSNTPAEHTSAIDRFMREGNLRVVVGVRTLNVQLRKAEMSHAQRLTVGTLFRALGFITVAWQIANAGSSGSLRDFYAAINKEQQQ